MSQLNVIFIATVKEELIIEPKKPVQLPEQQIHIVIGEDTLFETPLKDSGSDIKWFKEGILIENSNKYRVILILLYYYVLCSHVELF